MGYCVVTFCRHRKRQMRTVICGRLLFCAGRLPKRGAIAGRGPRAGLPEMQIAAFVLRGLPEAFNKDVVEAVHPPCHPSRSGRRSGSGDLRGSWRWIATSAPCPWFRAGPVCGWLQSRLRRRIHLSEIRQTRSLRMGAPSTWFSASKLRATPVSRGRCRCGPPNHLRLEAQPL